MVADYTVNGDSFVAGKARAWSQKSLVTRAFGGYDLTPDGKRFVVLQYPSGTAGQDRTPTDSVTVLLNFFDELKRRVPAGEK
jgi:hypothetical protein